MNRNKKNCKRLCVLLVSSLLLSGAPSIDALAATNQKLYNYTTASTMKVDDTKITYKYNGITINMPGTPGILTSNNVALGPYIYIMNKTLGISTKYDKAKKTVTFKKGSNTLVLTLGSKTAKLNGKNVQMNAAPISVKYAESKKTAILVPTRFVAETFGYYYEWNASTATVQIYKNQKLSYDNKTVNYTGVLGKVSLDGKNINVKNMPTFLIGNTAMVQAYRVYNNVCGVRYRYNRETGKLTFKKGDITLEMQLGSTIAVVNGIRTDCGVSPKLVKNLETGVESVMVPGMFTSKALGYDYSWNSDTKTSQIKTSPKVGVTPNITLNPGNDSNKPSDGSSTGSDGTYEEIKYFNWGVAGEYTGAVDRAIMAMETQKNLMLNSGSASTLSTIEEIISDSEVETLFLHFSNKLDSVSASHDGNKVTISLKNTIAAPQNLVGSKELIDQVEVVYDNVNQKTDIIVTLKGHNANYELVPSSDNMSLNVRFYPNYMTDIVAGQDNNGYQYISFTGLADLKPAISEDEDNVYLDFTNVRNGIGEQMFVAEGDNPDSINNVTITSSSIDSSTVVIQKPNPNVKFLIHEDGTTLALYIDREDKIPEINNTPIKIKLPSGVKVSSIKDEDLYKLKQFQIMIPGDHRDFYSKNPIANTYDNVANIKVTYNASKQTVITVTTNKIQGYKYQVVNGVLELTVDSPSKIYDRIVVLDAGHGGKDPGAVYGSAQEKVINFNVQNVYAKDMFAKAGIKVYYTRTDDTLIALADRASFASQVEADLFISVHCNAASNTAARGTSVYYSSINKGKGPTGLTSKILATNLVNNLSSKLGTKNLGTIDKGFVVVRDNTVPAVLVELAFLSNPEDKAKLVSASFQKNAAQTICDTVVQIFKTYPTNR
ncbi:MAG: N-acetylmuramoyl-L-alanine amidase [Clostridiales bacterium]|nr:N-acetylmuramoyl-L-alanine amidase [Clostridiales bacterium]